MVNEPELTDGIVTNKDVEITATGSDIILLVNGKEVAQPFTATSDGADNGVYEVKAID